jgi:ABC-2 type transport system ATP-binding protein
MTMHTVEAPTAPPRSALAATSSLPDDGMPILRMRGICKRWKRDQQPVLDELDLELRPGTTTSVDGRNGAGKTTMLRIAAGLIEPERGRTDVWGVTALENRARYQRLVSFLPAGDRGLYARLTVRRQLEFWTHITMLPRQRVELAVERALDDFDLRALSDRRVDRMSMGQRQRLRIAMTFLPDPELVLLDEPLTSLDADGARLLAAAIEALVARDGAVLWCSPSGEEQHVPVDARWTLIDGKLAST